MALPRLVNAETSSTHQAREQLLDMPGGVFVRPRYLGEEGRTLAMLLRHLDDTGVLAKVAHGVYYKPSSRQDTPSPADVASVLADEVEWVDMTGRPTSPPASASSSLLTRDFLQEEYVEKARSLADIAREVHCGPKPVALALARAGIPQRPRSEATSVVPGLTREFLVKEYVRAQREISDLAAELSCSERTVRRALRIHNLPQRTPSRPRDTLTPEFLRRHYLDLKESTVEIARLVGCSDTTVANALIEAGIPRRSPHAHDKSDLLTSEYLTEHFVTKGETQKQIAADLSIHRRTVARHLRRLGLA